MQPRRLLFSLLAFVAASDCSPDGPTTNLESGPIFGTKVNLQGGTPVNKFLGIPFGAIPERFALARDPKPWTEPLNATGFGPSCLPYYATGSLAPELDLLKDLLSQDGPQSEDCLSINVFSPATPGPEEGRPVVLFIPGGAFQQGNGRMDLSGFAAYEDVIALTLNYRVNVFGFPNAPEIPLEERNAGMHDQRLALKWIQKNIAAFGGDPSKVTLWGQSAGAMSIDMHLNGYADANPPPFHAAMMYSGQMSWGMLGLTGRPSDSQQWDSLSKSIGCPEKPGEKQMECMRTANATQMLEQMQKLGLMFMPSRDNVTVPSQTAEHWRTGKGLAKVPILTGTVAQEGRLLVKRNISLDMFMAAYFPDPLVTPEQRDAIVKYYRDLPEIKNDFDLAAAIDTDYFWQCALLAKASASIDNPTWRFYFNKSFFSTIPGYEWLGKAHGTDIMLLSSTPTFEGDANGIPLTPELYTFGHSFRSLSAQFIRNPRGGPGWPAVSSQYAPFDVANLGDLGNVHTAGVTPVNQTQLDDRCFLYEELYPILEKNVMH